MPMTFKLLSSFFCLLIIGLNSPSAHAATDLDQLCARFPQNSRCEGYVPSRGGSTPSREAETGYSILNTQDWRTSEDVPLSVPVIINDPFDGNYLAVIDKNFSGRITLGTYQEGVITNWSENYIRVYAYAIQKPCSGVSFFCPPTVTVRETSSLDIKVGEQVFRLEGSNGNFPVSSELAIALSNAPPGPALTRITLEDSGELITNEIGSDTTAAWKVVYQELSAEPTASESSSAVTDTVDSL